jgi:hypothetical protein
MTAQGIETRRAETSGSVGAADESQVGRKADAPYLACLCGAREDDTNQPTPRTCWNCNKETMGAYR